MYWLQMYIYFKIGKKNFDDKSQFLNPLTSIHFDFPP